MMPVHLRISCQGIPGIIVNLNTSAEANVHVLSGIPRNTNCTLRRICRKHEHASVFKFGTKLEKNVRISEFYFQVLYVVCTTAF